MHHRDVATFFQPFFNNEAFRLDVFEVNAPKARRNQFDRFNELFVFGCEFNVDAINVGKAFEETAFPPDRFTGRAPRLLRPRTAVPLRSRPRCYLGGEIVSRVGVVLISGTDRPRPVNKPTQDHAGLLAFAAVISSFPGRPSA